MLIQWRFMAKWLTLTLGLICFIASGLGLVFYLPAVLNGPSSLDYLTLTQCKIQTINYRSQFCPPPNDGFLNPYKLQWDDCILVEVQFRAVSEIENLNQTLDSVPTDSLPILPGTMICNWIFPISYETRNQADIAVRARNFQVGKQIDCVLDQVHDHCFPVTSEILEIILITCIPFVIGVILLSIFLFLHYKKQDWIFSK